MAIFTPNALRDWLRYSSGEAGFVEETAQQVEKIVTGWLTAEVGPLPDSVEEGHPLYAWALELGGIAYENPTSMSTDQSGETSSAWADRRLQILASARRWAEEQASPVQLQAPQPLGSFPPPYLVDPFGARR